MIEIVDKLDCCGCSACVQICPIQCISMQEDYEGFLYPKVDEAQCLHCNKCEKICPVINRGEIRLPLLVLAAVNPVESIRMQSSSGGVFTALAEHIIHEGGVVFGACFDANWEVHHTYTETIDGLSAFRGSKYVQSKIENTYKEAKVFLQEGRKVLFSGTPCQIAGLKNYLGKTYDNLITVDVICHGVPSPLVWRDYLKYITRPKGGNGKNTVLSSLNEMPPIGAISFRDKRNGWQKYGFVVRGSGDRRKPKKFGLPSVNDKKEIVYETHSKNLFMQGFLKDLYLRPSCHNCPSKAGRSVSDISLADFWGVMSLLPDFFTDEGVSLVLAYSERGFDMLNSLGLEIQTVRYEDALARNRAIVDSAYKPVLRDDFWNAYDKFGIGAIKEFVYRMRPSLKSRCRNALAELVKSVIGAKMTCAIIKYKNEHK